jgi:hypothetical protein
VYRCLLDTQIWVPTQHSNLGTRTYSTLKFGYLVPTQHSNLGTYSTLKFEYYRYRYLLNTQIWVPTQHPNLGTYSTLKFGYLLNTEIWVPVPTQHSNWNTTSSTLKFGYLYLLNSQFRYLLNTQLFTVKNSHRWS